LGFWDGMGCWDGIGCWGVQGCKGTFKIVPNQKGHQVRFRYDWDLELLTVRWDYVGHDHKSEPVKTRKVRTANLVARCECAD
jgi:hypothetical protein